MYTFSRGAPYQTFSVMQKCALSPQTAPLIRALTKLLKTADGVYETRSFITVFKGEGQWTLISPMNLVTHVSLLTL